MYRTHLKQLKSSDCGFNPIYFVTVNVNNTNSFELFLFLFFSFFFFFFFFLLIMLLLCGDFIISIIQELGSTKTYKRISTDEKSILIPILSILLLNLQ